MVKFGVEGVLEWVRGQYQDLWMTKHPPLGHGKELVCYPKVGLQFWYGIKCIEGIRGRRYGGICIG